MLASDSVSPTPERSQSLRDASSAERKKRVDSSTAFALGTIDELQGNLEQALQYYSDAVTNDPQFLLAKIRKGRVLFNLQRVTEATAILEEVRASGIASAELNSLLAYCYHTQDNIPKAQEMAKQAIASASQDAEKSPTYYRNIAENLKKFYIQIEHTSPLETSKKILPLYERAAALDHDDLTLQILSGSVAGDAGEYKKAMEFFDQAYSRNPAYPGLRQAMLIILIMDSQKERAKKIVGELITEFPNTVELYSFQLALAAELGDKKLEEASLAVLKDKSPLLDDTIIKPSEIVLRARMFKGSVALLSAGADLLPKSPAVRFALALAQRETDDTAGSLATFKRVEEYCLKEAQPLTSYFYYQYGATLDKAKKMSEAEETLQKALTLDPKNHFAMNHLGYMWAEHSINLPEAEKLLQKALELNPDESAYLDSLGWIYFQMGRYPDAEKYLSKALVDMPDDPVVNEHMGDIQKKLGRTEKALQFWEKSVAKSEAKSQDKPRVQQKIDQAKAFLTTQRQ